MDWNDKFHSILEETERNLASAKVKLTVKEGASPRKINKPDRASSLTEVLSEIKGKRTASTFEDMSTSTSLQVFQMQEQIASQNRMIEKLQRLVKTLDSEREYYKEEISVLKRDIDLLNNAVKIQPSLINSELKVSSVKNEVMHEINKVKAMVHGFERDSNKQPSSLSPTFESDMWNIKENLSDNLEEVRYELSQMRRRIDHMEDRLALTQKTSSSPDRLHKNFTETDHLLNKPLYTPTNGAVPRPFDTDFQLLRLNISSLCDKLDNLERRNQIGTSRFQPNSSPPRAFFQSTARRNLISSSVPRYSTYVSDGLIMDDDNFDANSLSDLSDLSNLSVDGHVDDLDFDLLTLNLRGDEIDSPLTTELESAFSGKSKKRGKVEFDLNDLDLSDLEDEDNVNLDSDDLEYLYNLYEHLK